MKIPDNALADTPFWVAFSRIPAIGRARIERLETAFGSLRDAWTASAADLKEAGLDAKALGSVLAHRPSIDPDAEMDRLERGGISPLTWHDPRYPARLRESYDKPPVLYLRGTLVVADDWSVAVVGTRRATPYGRQAAEGIVEGLVHNGVTVVSGLARGIDAVAHQSALRAGGRTIAVLPCPVNEVYPAGHGRLAEQVLEQGALLSDYPLDARMQRESFWRRNRIVASMTLGTVVVEAGEKSGALLTARLALDENREVFAVPGSIFAPMSKGPNGLIQQGAKLVRSADDILSELDLMRVPQQLEMRQTLPVDATETALLSLLSTEPLHVDDITRDAHLPVATVSGALAMLELKGMIRQVGGMQYVRV
jgi:DNA processing protein